MILKRILSTYTFRFMLFYVTALAVAVFILLAITYGFYSIDFHREVNASLEKELDIYQQRYQTQGIDQVQELLSQRSQQQKFNILVVLASPELEVLAGDLPQWPKLQSWPQGWYTFDVDIRGEAAQTWAFLGRSRTLDDGSRLIVARHSDDIRINLRLVFVTLTWSMLIMIALGLVGGLITSFMSLRRLEGINSAIQAIMTGDLSERIPVNSTLDDFDRLAINLNNMLDQIQALMTGVRQVSDNIAHDLRTPLTRLRNNLAELQQKVPEEQLADVERLLLEADGLLSTFSALLRITQVESGNRRSGFTNVDLSMMLDDVVDLYEPLGSDKGQRVQSKLQPGMVLRGDRDLLFQAFANLLDNAIKYTPEGGDVNIVASGDEQFIKVIISDSGPGISTANREKVFQRFFRVEESRSQSGNGLGLSLVAAVIKLHQGDIQLKDNKPGLQVIVRLPVESG